MLVIVIAISVAANLLVLGAHAAVPWHLARTEGSARRGWGLSALPLFLFAVLLTLARFGLQPDRVLDAGFRSPLWTTPRAQALALLVLTLGATDVMLLGAHRQLSRGAWRMTAALGLAALIGLAYYAETFSPLASGSALRFARAGLRAVASVAVGMALGPIPPARSVTLITGALGVMAYLFLVPLDALVVLWRRGDVLLALAGAVLLFVPRLPPFRARSSGWARGSLVAAALVLGLFWARLGIAPPTRLVSCPLQPSSMMTRLDAHEAEQVGLKLPLFPLPNAVHFPRTELRLHIFEPRYRSLIRDLLTRAEDERWIGMVLLRPDAQVGVPNPPIFRSGTASRLAEVEPLPDGRSNIVLHGGFRFEVENELRGRPYRQATVRVIGEPSLEEDNPGVAAVRGELLDRARSLAGELAERFPLSLESVKALTAGGEIETVVNALAANLDLPVLRKLQLLAEPLPERALSVLGILRSRQKVLDLLRPFRHLAAGIDHN